MDVADVTPPATAIMGPPSRTSPDEANGHHEHLIGGMGTGMGDHPSAGGSSGPNAAAAAAAGSQQPKIVQTAFIHKLYKSVHYAREKCHKADGRLVCWKIQAYST